jgi:hypothetical protein
VARGVERVGGRKEEWLRVVIVAGV